MSIPTPCKVNENSEGLGILKAEFKKSVLALPGISRRLGGIKEKNLHAGVLIFSRRTHTGSPKEQQRHFTLSYIA